MMGHIYANMIGNKLEYPLLSLIVSGGHTDLILMKDESNFEYLGQTLDDAIGEAYDKVARILSLPYPGGPNVEKYALQGEPTYKMPQILNDESFNFSFSGTFSNFESIYIIFSIAGTLFTNYWSNNNISIIFHYLSTSSIYLTAASSHTK
jgi:tRNA A37 threonylcarbamoyltransferase TsaD